MPKKPTPISPRKLERWALQAVREVADLDIPGHRKHRKALKVLAQKIDDAIELPGILEAVDGPVISLLVQLLGGFVEDAYERHKAGA